MCSLLQADELFALKSKDIRQLLGQNRTELSKNLLKTNKFKRMMKSEVLLIKMEKILMSSQEVLIWTNYQSICLRRILR